MLDGHRKLAYGAHALFNVFGAQDRFAHFHALVEEDLVGFGDVGGGHGGGVEFGWMLRGFEGV